MLYSSVKTTVLKKNHFEDLKCKFTFLQIDLASLSFLIMPVICVPLCYSDADVYPGEHFILILDKLIFDTNLFIGVQWRQHVGAGAQVTYLLAAITNKRYNKYSSSPRKCQQLLSNSKGQCGITVHLPFWLVRSFGAWANP